MKTKAMVVEGGLSPDEVALLQIARDLGVVGQLLEEAQRRKTEAAKTAAYEKALTIATQQWQAAIHAGAKEARVEVTVSMDGVDATAVYPAPKPKSKTERGRDQENAKYPDQLVAQLKEESRKRGVTWFGVANAIRTSWGRTIYEQFMQSAQSAEPEPAEPEPAEPA